ncbi:MAG: hypothetical protein M1820_010870 [Bogoriella megaspora]|nr:MAG: hypothetical protein M1820_010870 [Bogoriella megaspora]
MQPLQAFLALSLFPIFGAAQIPPSFSPSASQQLSVTFGNGAVSISPGELIGINVPAQQPQLGLSSSASSDSTYILVMVDPDAPTPQNPSSAQILHWIQPNLTLSNGVLTATSQAFAPYARPMPPTYSDAHRYIQFLYSQPERFIIPQAYLGYSAQNRTKFNISNFAAAANLGNPVAANYFLVANNTGSIAPNATGTAGGNGSVPSPTITPFTGGAERAYGAQGAFAGFLGALLVSLML